jgi:hypothetical protein
MQISTINSIITGLFLLTIVCLLILALVDRFWGKRTLGNLVKPRSILIYENRPWWMEEVAMYAFIFVSLITITPLVIIFFFSNHASEAFLTICPLYIVSFLWIICSIVATHPKRGKQT